MVTDLKQISRKLVARCDESALDLGFGIAGEKHVRVPERYADDCTNVVRFGIFLSRLRRKHVELHIPN